MPTFFPRFIYVLAMMSLAGCATIPAAFVGDPAKTGFVVVEGEAAIAVQTPDSGIMRWRYSEIQEVTLQSAQQPLQTVRGRYRAGLTWFSDLQPGTYRVKDIRLSGETSDATFRLPQDALPESGLTFTIGAGEMRYLGYIEITQSNPNFVRFNVVHNRDEMRAWEHVYDFYAKTPWEPLLLKKIESVK